MTLSLLAMVCLAGATAFVLTVLVGLLHELGERGRVERAGFNLRFEKKPWEIEEDHE